MSAFTPNKDEISNIIFFVLYKVWLVFDDFDFVFWKELPLQLCNINMFLIIIAAKYKNKFFIFVNCIKIA